MGHAIELRKLAEWYRELANKAADPDARSDRLRAAALLEREADFTERAFSAHSLALRAEAEVQIAG
jgi:hypothetical protein